MNRPSGDAAQQFMPLGDALRLAERYRGEGRLMEAETICRRLLEAQPNLPDAEHVLGLIAHQGGKLSEAIEHVQRATKLAPQVALFQANLGEMYRLAGRPKLAVEAARRATEIDAAMPAAHSNLGAALFDLKDFEAAARAHRKAITINPSFAEGHNSLGNALYSLRQFDEAIASYRRAIELRPDFADAWANLGTAQHHAGAFEDARVSLRRAISLAPGHANARSGLGILLLMRGDLAEGWEEYEWRLRSSERKGPRFPERPWQGESLAGKHIYVQAEQGFGDTLQFARYLPLLAARAGKVTVRTHQQLLTLLRESLPGVTVLGDRGEVGSFDYDAALLSLPRLFRTRLESIPADIQYLRPPAAVAERWRKRLAEMSGIKVGVVWAGNPEHVNDARRSVSLPLLEPLFDIPGVSFASLQVGARAADLKALKRRERPIEDLSRDFGDFDETAGAATALDLVITVDTSVAHLAGALGKPVWVLLPWVTDWRWLLEREDNPWYPSMRLFRQKKGEDWVGVIGRMTKELATVVQGDTLRLTPFLAEGQQRAAEAAAIIAAEVTEARLVPDQAPRHQTALPPGQALMLAEQKRRHGFIGDADELVRQAASADPNNADAAHMLGILAHQSGKTAEAIEHLRRAIAIEPNAALYHANIGEMYRLIGKTDEAIASARRAIEIHPEHAGALSNLGVALFEQEKFDEALAHYDRAIAIQPDFVQAHSNRGNALQRLKRFAEAEAAYRRAIELHPAFQDAWGNLGTCLRELKRSEEAEAAYRKALELGPNNPETLDNLALALKDLERLDEAAELLRRALTIEARNDKFHIHHASILLGLHKTDDAAAAADRALALNPNSHDAANLLGQVAYERHDLQSALTHYRRALALKPDLADALNNVGNVLKDLGRLEEARSAYLEAVRIDPDVSGVYVNLADSMTFALGNPHLAKMEELAAKADGLSKTDRLQLDFALGKAHADLKDYKLSFRHFLAGNAGKRAQIQYDESATLALFDEIERTFTSELINAKSGGGDPSVSPIFVLGMPRSGTTLVEQILASHPRVHGAGELATLNDVVLTVHGPDGKTIPYPHFVSALDLPALRKIGGRYLGLVRQLAPSSERITDKMPSNFFFVGLIHLALPNAKIVHTVRDPVDTCISCFSKLFSAEQNHTYDLAELGRYYKRYERLMAHWRNVLPPGRILDVHYEDVVSDLEGQARGLLDHCALPWNERCLSFHKTERPVRTASATQVRKPIYKNSVGRWRVYEEFLTLLLAELGVSPH